MMLAIKHLGRCFAVAQLLLAFNAAPLLRSADTTHDGITAFSQGRYSVALRLLANSADKQGRTFFHLAQAATGHCGQALPGLLQTDHNDSKLWKLAGTAAVNCYLASGEMAKALPLAYQLQEKFPADPDVLYAVAEAHLQGFNGSTLAMYQKTPASYRVHQLSAQIFEVQNRYSEAVAEYKKAIELNPRAADLHFRLGRALLFQNHEPATIDQAKLAFEAELRISPEDSVCHYEIGQINLVRGEKSQAESEFKQAAALNPDFAAPDIALAKLLLSDRNYAEAINLLQRATALQPDNETAHYSLMTAYRNAGRLEDARREKATLDKLQKPPSGEFSDFLKKLGEKPPPQQ